MDNAVFNMMLVAKHASKFFPNDDANKDFIDSVIGLTKLANDHIVSLSPDKRSIAIGGSDEIWRWEAQANYSEGYTEFAQECQLHDITFMVASKNPSSILITSPDAMSLVFAWMHYANKELDITFVNNMSLYFYESFFKGKHEIFDFPYSVVDVQDLENDEQYDIVASYAWDVSSNEEYLNLLIDRVAPGGCFWVNLTNYSAKLYSPDFELHPFYDMHEVLKSVPNSSVFHNPAFAATTTLVKH